MFDWLKNRRRKRLLDQPWPADWSPFLQRNVRLAEGLTASETAKLQRLMRVFVDEKHWEGCRGLELTVEMQVTIAGNACLMLLGKDDFYFDKVKTILIYPGAFRRQVDHGLVRSETSRSGEAWQGGPIVLSWSDVLHGGRNRHDGHNLVIHEFAHVLDGLDGAMGGTLMFQDGVMADRWSQVVDREYLRLCQAARLGPATLLDKYGATSKAEFFAVATEVFFELPRELQAVHRELFDLLKAYFQVDPVRWND